MSRFARNIRSSVTRELQLATVVEPIDPAGAFCHLERAHVLGQESTRQHVRAHIAMLRWAIRQQAHREMIGQVVRIIGAATKTAIRLVPEGNTGGTNISPFRRLPISDDLRREIRSAHG